MPGEIVEDIGHHDIVFFAADHRRHSVEVFVVETVAAAMNRIQDSRRILCHSLLGILYVHEKVVGSMQNDDVIRICANIGIDVVILDLFDEGIAHSHISESASCAALPSGETACPR